MKSNFFLLSLLAIAFIGFAFTNSPEQKKGGNWKIPTEYKTKANTLKGDAEALKLGKTAYAKHCRSCHGNLGAGDGPKAKNLETHPGDFTDTKWQSGITDGELYYMSIIGRDEMPNFESKITDDEERWGIINYIRSRKK